MSTTYGPPPVSRDGLISIFDVKNQADNFISTSEWKMRSFTNEDSQNNFSVNPGIYDANLKAFVTNGTDEVVNLAVTADTQPWWGKTISIRCKPLETGAYIFNDTNGTQLYYTDDKKLTVLTSPHNYSYKSYTCIGIDSSNNITLLGCGSNNNPTALKIDIAGNVLGYKADPVTYSFSYSYAYGKIIFDEIDGLQWVQILRGYTASYDFLNPYSDSREKYLNNVIVNAAFGEGDTDASNFYSTGSSYAHNAYKVPKDDYTKTVFFGIGAATDATTGLSSPRGIARETNYIFVGDTNNHRIMVLDDMTYYTHLGVTGVSGTDASHFNAPRGMQVKNGKLYITDYWNQRIQIFDEITLEYLDTIDTPFYPTYLSVNDNYIAFTNADQNMNIGVVKISDKSLILQKSSNYLSYGPGGYGRYGAKGIRKDETIDGSIGVVCMDRNNRLIVINASDLTYGTYKRIYINNELKVESDSHDDTTGTGDWHVGAWDAPTYHRRMKGYVDMLKIYNKVLSDIERTKNYNAVKGRYIS